MQTKLNLVSETTKLHGLKRNIQKKTKSLRINANAAGKFLQYGKEIAEVESFNYLGSVIDKSGGLSASCIN